MTAQQRVGQLFIVSFPGTDAGGNSDIAKLITDYYIGGVQLKASAQNFTNDSDEPVDGQIRDLVGKLQGMAIRGTTNVPPTPDPDAVATPTRTPRPLAATVTPTIRLSVDPRSIPLFIGIAQDNDLGGPIDLPELRSGARQSPNALALGATWNPNNAAAVGAITGGDLSRMGVNLYFGPSLDVMDTPRPGTPGDLGTRVFGGDPFWVGRFGVSFIEGVRAGSGGKVATVVRNFPGLGASDRNASEEVPTIQKSLEQLKQSELLPYFAVTQRETISDVVTDGLQVAHIRYRGFQGNSRTSTRPVSVDPQAYQDLMALPPLASWRERGGVTFSEELGVRSLRRFYEPTDSAFSGNRVAQEAFAAGNDVLVLGRFPLGSAWEDQLSRIKDAIAFFQTRYVDDPSFAARVDESVRRILMLKLKIHGGAFSLSRAVPTGSAVSAEAQAETAKQIADIARKAVTRLSESREELASVAPNRNESIVFFTDDRPLQECARCAPYPAIPTSALKDITLAFYGPSKTGQVEPANLKAYSLDALAEYNALSVQAVPTISETVIVTDAAPVASPTATLTDTETTLELRQAISAANWIVFAVLDVDNKLRASQALRQFLATQADTLRDKRVVVFAFGAPYYLDATEVSKITAYYGVYSRAPASLEAAVRVLFNEFAPSGFSPVSVPATEYRLDERTSPNPAQLIPLRSDVVLTTTQSTPEPLTLKLNDKLDVTAGPILDLNGNNVPDGTEVLFKLNYPSEGVEQPGIAAVTRNGFARIMLTIDRQGTLNITAESNQAKRSDTIRVNAAPEGVIIDRITPTVQPTSTPVPTQVPTLVPTPAPTAVPAPPAPIVRASMSGFVLTILLLLGVSIATFIVLSGFRGVPSSVRLRAILGTWTIGWLAYVLYTVGAPGTTRLSSAFGWVGGPMIAGVVALVAFGFVTIVIRLQRNESA